MKGNTALKILGLIALASGVYFGVTYLRRRLRGIPISGGEIAKGNVTIEESSDGIYVVETSTKDAFYSYKFTGRNMEFPLSQPITKDLIAYDNVAKVQAFLLFSNPNLEMPIDGIFGKLTRDAVFDEVDGLNSYGYADVDYISKPIKTETITKEYYNEVVLPELKYFLDNQ